MKVQIDIRACEVTETDRRNALLPGTWKAEDTERIIKIRLLDTGRYDLEDIFDDVKEYFRTFLTAAGFDADSHRHVMSFCVLGLTEGDGITMAFAWMRAMGWETDFSVLRMEVWTRWDKIYQRMPFPSETICALLGRLDRTNARFIANLIDILYESRLSCGTEEDLRHYEMETVPRDHKYIDEDTVPSQEELADRYARMASYNYLEFDRYTTAGFTLNCWLDDAYSQAAGPEEKKRAACLYIELDYDCWFPWTAWRMVMDGSLPHIGTWLEEEE